MKLNEMRARTLHFDILMLEEVVAELGDPGAPDDTVTYNREKVRRVMDSLRTLHRDLASLDRWD